MSINSTTSGRPPQNKTILQHIDLMGGFELLSGSYVQHDFPRHAHAEYLIGVIESGIHDVWCRREWWHASPNTIATFSPEETHYGGSGHESGWKQTIFYFPQSMITKILDSDYSDQITTWRFDQPFQYSEDLSRRLIRLRQLLASDAEPLLLEQTLFKVVEEVFSQLSGYEHPHDKRKQQPEVLAEVTDYIEDNISQSFDIKSLSELSGFSKRQFMRCFQKQFQMAPYQYIMLTRVRRAHALLKAGNSIVDAALKAGFADQSHLTRNFRAIYGVTPARYFSSGR